MVATSPNYRKHTEANPAHRLFLGRFHQRVLELAGDALAQRPSASPPWLLDVGCGEGFVLAMLAQKLAPLEMLGLDLNPQALTWVGWLCPQARLVQAEAAALPLASASFDLVLCLEVLEHLPEPEAALAELCRVSRGPVILSVPHQPYFSLANMLRGRYLRSWGDAPGHRHRWGKARFLTMVSEHLRPWRVVNSFPWILVLGAPAPR